MIRKQRRGPAVFLGAGIHSSLGNGIDANLAALKTSPQVPRLLKNTLTDDTLEIPYKILSDSPLIDSQERLFRVVDDVVEQALTEAGLSESQRHSMNVYLGSSSFDIGVSEAHFQQQLAVENDACKALALPDPSMANLADYVLQSLGIRGEDMSFNTACTASANALMTAVAHVEAGIVEHALVLGVELYNNVTALGFYSLDLLTQSVMRPFDSERDGLVLGEGVSALVIGRDPEDGGTRFYLRGGANLCDTYSITMSNVDGSAIAEVMTQALDKAGVSPAEIDLIKVHGTASLANDEAESAGMHAVFSTLPNVCALKPFIGHTLGACGLNELILFYRAIEAGFLIATPGISADAGDLNVVLNQELRTVAPGCFMLNYFGFGGNNTSLIISNKHDCQGAIA
ncbi:3-oxoacyl-[acyl-carrier-protein] synthase 2 [Zhongshania aliphaticivorans]|uniref:3-oxoacyl-[acyl-carrier-protein] synthase 2 n=1 Tax=Zhongshania aliphaticivorans TaxID=1470434 RepID=A0A5S9PPU3_9GAMM|nr:beta-ketoacyl synthase N-terminal-like domain-containing protein [Zhongshania aliphaticivorans]CAA0106483.1 3-oxoacyl-[acyl-carrier-protein] synthase 2 [Zhongshania aliphaticivorans]CAA0106627.1 3-oxoacyl-[acyl-carrier-protein] synthase 2 [Zhongshania aliphaticivorans]